MPNSIKLYFLALLAHQEDITNMKNTSAEYILHFGVNPALHPKHNDEYRYIAKLYATNF